MKHPNIQFYSKYNSDDTYISLFKNKENIYGFVRHTRIAFYLFLDEDENIFSANDILMSHSATGCEALSTTISGWIGFQFIFIERRRHSKLDYVLSKESAHYILSDDLVFIALIDSENLTRRTTNRFQ
jgi:hypothetical protein